MVKVLALACVLLLTTPLVAMAGDPTGAATGGAADVAAANSGAPTLQELAAEVGHSKVASNFVWMLLAGFLVMFMQAGFAFCETGFTRAKNASHTMAMNMMVYGIGLLGSAAGAVSAMIAINYLRGKPDLSFMANGLLA